jgi:hypothetical protein
MQTAETVHDVGLKRLSLTVDQKRYGPASSKSAIMRKSDGEANPSDPVENR